ncbi:MAG: DoxX family protein [Candidatus Acidiferrum sp.]
MNPRLARASLPLLRWTLGLAVILESVRFVFSKSAAHFLSHAGLPSWIQPTLGGAETLAAILFLVPFTSRTGGYALLFIFGLAALVHLLHGQWGVEGLIVYAAAVLACTAFAEKRTTGAHHD